MKRESLRNSPVEIRWEKDGEVEQKQVQNLDWKQAFAALEKLDLNRTAYRDVFVVDSITSGDQQIIRYQASELGVKPQSLLLVKSQGRLVRLEVEVSEKNFLYESNTHYSYVPDDTLSISGTQRVIFGKNHSYKRSYWY